MHPHYESFIREIHDCDTKDELNTMLDLYNETDTLTHVGVFPHLKAADDALYALGLTPSDIERLSDPQKGDIVAVTHPHFGVYLYANQHIVPNYPDVSDTLEPPVVSAYTPLLVNIYGAETVDDREHFIATIVDETDNTWFGQFPDERTAEAELLASGFSADDIRLYSNANVGLINAMQDPAGGIYVYVDIHLLGQRAGLTL